MRYLIRILPTDSYWRGVRRGGCFRASPKPNPAPSPEQDDVIRVNTELVQTDVMVFDKKGQFVDGLKAEQFALKVDDKPQTISFLDRVTSGKASAEPKHRRRHGYKFGEYVNRNCEESRTNHHLFH